MTTSKLDLVIQIPNLKQQFARQIIYLVGYYSGSCFLRKAEFRNYEDALTRCDEYKERGLDARIIECRIETFCVL